MADELVTKATVTNTSIAGEADSVRSISSCEQRASTDSDHGRGGHSRYAVIGEIARGGLGRILEGIDQQLNRPVAIKELLRGEGKGSRRFLREAAITARLQHPAIVPVYDSGVWSTGRPSRC